jgi:putative transposase
VARPIRIHYPGALYHVTARGNAKQDVFLGEVDYEDFLARLERVIGRYRFRCHAYCLLGNHYHLLLDTPMANLALGMQQLNSGYAQAFNRRHGRIGHVFQGRYWAILVESERHLLEVSRYIVLNPVRAGLCRRPEEWRWSSYRATIGMARPSPVLTIDWLLGCFGQDAVVARERLRQFVELGDGMSPWEELQAGTYLGSREFAKRVSAKALAGVEVPKAQRLPVRPELSELLRVGSGAEIAVAHRDHGYRLNEIASQLGIHYATVGRRLRAWEEGRPMSQRKI